MRFSKDGKELIVTTGWPGLEEDWVSKIDIKTTVAKRLYSSSEFQKISVSNQDNVGNYVIADSGKFTLLDSHHCILREETAPEGRMTRCFLSPNGRVAFAKLSKGGKLVCWNLSKKNSKPKVVLPELGYMSSIGLLSDSEFLCELELGKNYDLVVINMNSLKILRRLLLGIVNPLQLKSFDVDVGGTLYLGNHKGHLFRFTSELIQYSSVETEIGRIQQVLSHPEKPKVVVLSGSGAVRWADSESGQYKPYYHPNGHIVDHGSGRGKLYFIKKDELFLGSTNSNQSSFVQGASWVWWSSGKKLCIWNRTDGIPGKTGIAQEEYLRIILPWTWISGTDLYNQPIVLTSEGKLLAIDGQNYQLDQRGKEHYLKPDGPHITTLLENIKSPKGIRKLDRDRLAIWTETAVMVLRFSSDLKMVNKPLTVEVKGVRKVKLDPFSKRLIFLHTHHLSFRTETLEECYRLYTLDDDTSLLHIPLPRHLRKPPYDKHPGYFFHQSPHGPVAKDQTNKLISELFEVLNAFGKPVVNEDAKGVFMEDYFNEYTVRKAVRDYRRFIADEVRSRVIGGDSMEDTIGSCGLLETSG